MRRLNLHTIAVIFLLFFSFSASIFVNRTVFERLPHLEDEFAYLYQARIFARLQAWVPRNEPVKIFWQPFVIQPEQSSDGVAKRFGKYTPGWPLLLASGAAIDSPWIVNAWFAMLNVALTYRLGREIFDKTVGLVGSLLLALSPMALLLNATLMSHPSAMFLTLLFVYAYWRLLKTDRWRYHWGLVAGIALGLNVISRPLTAAAIALPVALHALLYLIATLIRQSTRQRLLKLFVPLVVLTICAAPVAALWPLFNYIWTGDWRTNVYTLQWSYDRVGFGIGYGPNQQEGHTLTKGWRNARNDLQFYFRDLNGFTLDPSLERIIAKMTGWGAGAGLAWLLIALGLLAGHRRVWIWLLFALLVSIVMAQMAYWIGSSVNGSAAYSVRYYYEATFAICLVSAYGIVALARLLNGKLASTAANAAFVTKLKAAWQSWSPVYVLLLICCGLSLVGFTPARLRQPLPPEWNDGLWRYNKVGGEQIAQIEAMRQQYGQPGQQILIVVLRNPDPTIKDNWRDHATAMALTSPFLDSDVIVARVFEVADISEFTRRFPQRLVLYQIGEHLYSSVEAALRGAAQDTAGS
ncbi:MAG: glycosyltransferase family 39 protein [Anaerolineae bacterium]|nr:glycosyltransferase family 39 protein [Anaerolineae bacterium]